MSDGQSNESQQLRDEVRQLEQRLAEINQRLDRLATPPPPATPPPLPAAPPEIMLPPAPVEPPPVIVPPAMEVVAETAVAAPPLVSPPPPPIVRVGKESFEVRLGTYWLPRLGIVLLLTGLVFLVTWSYRYFEVWGKIALGYICALALGGFGWKLERKMPQFGRVLQAGALALAYFMTYALHYSETLRVIESPAVGLGLLCVVVAAIVIIANRQQSALLAGLALGLGYYTSLMSGVDTFTLAANAVLAAAALVFLSRNRWVPISYGAVLATYLAYAIWVLKINWGAELDRLIWDKAYLTDEQFRLRAGFLSLYWLLFTGGGLLVKRDAMAPAERNGLLTLNNALFFILFSLLMHHAYPSAQWQFQFCFGGALLVASAIAYQRFQPERSVMDTLFVQGLIVATLGVLNYFTGATLVAALALESVLLLMLSRAMASFWIAWIARLAFAVAASCAWDAYPDWETRMIWGATFAGAIGFVNARLERRSRTSTAGDPGVSLAGLFFAVLGAALLMTAGHEQFAKSSWPWVLTGSAVLVGLIGMSLRTREIVWSAHLPLAWAHASFYLAVLGSRMWLLDQSLALIAATFGFGILFWARARAQQGSDEQPVVASATLRPYAFFAMTVALLTTTEYCPEFWQLTVFGAEALILVLAGIVARESTFAWMAIVTIIVGAFEYLGLGSGAWHNRTIAWVNLAGGLVLYGLAERAIKARGSVLSLSERGQRGWRVFVVIVMTALAMYALRKLVAGSYLTVSWAMGGFVLLAFGFALKERPYRIAGLVALAFSLLRALFHDLAGVAMPYRILTFIGLGVILLLLAFLYAKNRDKLAKWL